MLYGTLVLALVGLALGIAGYASWQEKTQDFNGIISNWQATPIIDARFATGSCPAGYTQESALSSVSFSKTTTSTSSDGSSTSTTSTVSVDFPYYRGDLQMLCVKRQGSNALDRVRKAAADACPTGMHACGTTDCYYTATIGAGVCPTTTWATVSGYSQNTTTDPSTGVTTTSTPMDSINDLSLQMLSNQANGRAVVELQVRQGRPCVGQNPGEAVAPGKVCKDSIAIPSTGLPAGTSTDTVREDDRYQLLDAQSTGGITDGTYLGWQGSTLTEQVPYTNLPWYFSYRNEISWSVDCPQPRSAVVNVQSRVNAISGAQLALFIFSLITGLFNVYSFFVVYRIWTVDKDSIAADKRQLVQDKCNAVADGAMLIPNIVAIALAYQSKSFFASMETANCSDGTTTSTFTYLAKEITSIAGINVAKFVLCTLFLGYKVFSWWKNGVLCSATPQPKQP